MVRYKKVEAWQYQQRKSHPLQIKVRMTQERIRAWHRHYDGNVFVSFSGGLDSTVLLHIARGLYPDMLAVFFNTGLEFPETVRFINEFPSVEKLKPKRRFPWIVERYGWPIVSKRIAQSIYEVRSAKGETATKRLRLTGVKSNGELSPLAMIPYKWQYLCNAPFGISHKCCEFMKKKPSDEMLKRGMYPIIGTRADEGLQRLKTYYNFGCNAFDLKRPRSTPLAFWTHDDIWNYIRANNVSYSPIYDMGYVRTGCYCCGFGVHLEKHPNRFERLKETHPKLYRYVIDKLGMGPIIDYYLRGDVPLFNQQRCLSNGFTT